jgi:hypothetical protein
MFTQYRRIVTKYGLNGQADIYFPEDQGVVQIENFGIHLNADGACCRASTLTLLLICGVGPLGTVLYGNIRGLCTVTLIYVSQGRFSTECRLKRLWIA